MNVKVKRMQTYVLVVRSLNRSTQICCVHKEDSHCGEPEGRKLLKFFPLVEESHGARFAKSFSSSF